jgi:hypothetical protein
MYDAPPAARHEFLERQLVALDSAADLAKRTAGLLHLAHGEALYNHCCLFTRKLKPVHCLLTDSGCRGCADQKLSVKWQRVVWSTVLPCCTYRTESSLACAISYLQNCRAHWFRKASSSRLSSFVGTLAARFQIARFQQRDLPPLCKCVLETVCVCS